MNKIQIIGTAVLAVAIIAGCGKKESGTTAISVNGRVLTVETLNADIEKLIAAQGDRIPTNQLEYAKQMFKHQLAQSFIMENALVDAAKTAGYAVTDEDRKTREEEFLKNVANQPDAPKSLQEFIEKFPLGKDRAMEEFENGILIDKLLKAELAKESTDYTAEAQKIIDGVISNNTIAAKSDAVALAKIKERQANRRCSLISPRKSPVVRRLPKAVTSAPSLTARWSQNSTRSRSRCPSERSLSQ